MAKRVLASLSYTDPNVNQAILEVASEAYHDGIPRIFLSREGFDGVHPILDKASLEAICSSASDLSDDGYVRIHDFRVSFPAEGGEPLVMLGPRPSISITALGVSYWETLRERQERRPQ